MVAWKQKTFPIGPLYQITHKTPLETVTVTRERKFETLSRNTKFNNNIFF